MLYLSVFDAKEDVTIEEINREREEWVRKGKSKVFEKMCGRIERFEVAGSSPLKIYFIIDTEQPNALNILSHHFGGLWYSVSYPIIERGIFEALEEDRSIVAG